MDGIENKDSVKYEGADRFPCPGCGGNMVFSPETQSLECPYCGNKTELKPDGSKIVEHDFSEAQDDKNSDWGEEKRVIKCQSCGAETVLGEHAAAQFCSFCGSSYIVKTEESAGIAPESLVPFKVTQEKALEGFSKWIRKKYFAPSNLKKEYKNQRLSGVYIPFWTYDTDTYSTYTAEAGTYYYVTVTYTATENGKTVTKTRQERRTRWHFTSGDYYESFDDVLVSASKQAESGLIRALEPYHLNELVKYRPEYLSGFLAEKYSINLKDGFDRAADRIDPEIRVGITRKINADEVRNLNVNTTHSNIKYKHLLLPVWMSAYTYKNKVYRYMINGQTGEVQGHAPVSALKIAALVIAILAIIIAVGFFARNREAARAVVSLAYTLLKL